mmetsp:Transcript_34009/g.50785  ORF Transcript_34009/g.50785 Transcript_34009/m.50785 type:complete len:264 (-) Transcript_34009:507-1298(-)
MRPMGMRKDSSNFLNVIADFLASGMGINDPSLDMTRKQARDVVKIASLLLLGVSGDELNLCNFSHERERKLASIRLDLTDCSRLKTPVVSFCCFESHCVRASSKHHAPTRCTSTFSSKIFEAHNSSTLYVKIESSFTPTSKLSLPPRPRLQTATRRSSCNNGFDKDLWESPFSSRIFLSADLRDPTPPRAAPPSLTFERTRHAVRYRFFSVRLDQFASFPPTSTIGSKMIFEKCSIALDAQVVSASMTRGRTDAAHVDTRQDV